MRDQSASPESTHLNSAVALKSDESLRFHCILYHLPVKVLRPKMIVLNLYPKRDPKIPFSYLEDIDHCVHVGVGSPSLLKKTKWKHLGTA